MAQSKIKVLIDVAVDGANRSLGSFKKSIQDADGAANKMRAGVGGAFNSIKANAGSLALAGGAALVTFGVKAVGAFQDTALEAGKLRDSLGLTAEEASKLMEVAGDLDIPVKNLENSIGKMNVVAERTPKFFDDIGASIAENKDGTTNVNQTFLNTVDALNKIPDASKRASAAQRIFGKDWRTISELIGRGSEELKRNLDQVGASKVFDDKEIKKAREFHDKMDELKDTVEEVVIGVGGFLVPALADGASALLGIKSAAEQADEGLGGIPGKFFEIAGMGWNQLFPTSASDAITAIDKAIEAAGVSAEQLPGKFGAITDAADSYTTTTEEATDATEAASKWQDALADSLDNARKAQEAKTEAVLASLDSDLAYRNQVAETTAVLNEYQSVEDDAKTAINEHDAAARDAEAAVMAQAAAAVALAEDQAAANDVTITAEEKTKVYQDELARLAAFMTGPARDAILSHIAALDGIQKSIYTNVSFTTGTTRNQATGQRVGNNAKGTDNWQGGPTWVGEEGAEIVDLPRGAHVTPNDKIAAALGNTYNIYGVPDAVSVRRELEMMAWQAGAR